MKLVSLQLHNFRQFYGTTPIIHFSLGEKNVTVIHGINGSGKTALLNAFTWVLYESHTRGFQLPEQLVNKRAIREAKIGDTVVCWVEINFDHNNRKYELRRSAEVLKESNDSWTFRGSRPPALKWSDDDGIWRDARDVDDAIGRVLPEDLLSYFFFDGERIERIVQPEKKEKTDLAKATKILLGMKILERGEQHLNNARKEFEKELRNIGDTETKQLLERKESQEQDLEKENKRKEELAQEIDAHQQIRAEIQDRLRKLSDASHVQEKYDRLERSHKAYEEGLMQNRKSLKNEISNYGYSVFLTDATGHFRAMIDGLRKRGELPAGIKKQFVDDLLINKVCICGRPIDEHSMEARAAVEEWRKRAGMADVEEKAIRMGGEVAKTEEIIPAFWERVDTVLKKDSADRTELAQIEKELENLRDQLRNSPQEQIRDLERRLTQAETAIDNSKRLVWASERHIRDLKENIQSLQKEIGQHEAKEERHSLLNRRIAATIDARDRIIKIHELLDLQLRANLNARIRQLFHQISVTPYVPDLNEDYSLTLHETAGGSKAMVAPSQGESQILSFCFIGAIVEEAKKFHAKQQELPGPESAEFPVVMDSPFGSLDPEYRRQLCEHLHKLADQVVIFVTKTQWRGEVENTLTSKIGRSYVLTYYSPRDDLDKVTEESDNRNIRLNGGRYDLLKQSPNDFEFTEIQEVAYA